MPIGFRLVFIEFQLILTAALWKFVRSIHITPKTRDVFGPDYEIRGRGRGGGGGGRRLIAGESD